MSVLNQVIILEAASNQDFPRIGNEFHGVIRRPDIMAGIPNKPFVPNFNLTLTTPAAAPVCMCDEIRDSVDGAREIIEAYNDPDLMSFALEFNISSTNNEGEMLKELNTIPVRAETGVVETFYDMVRAKFRSELNDANMPRPLPLPLQSFDKTQGHVAFMYNHNCEIIPPRQTKNDGICMTSVVRDAYLKHEEVHEKHCTTLDADHGQGTYQLWSNYPPNLVATETSAYNETIRVLEDWLDRYCDS